MLADLLSIDDLPPDFEYPPEFIRVVELGLTNLEPWWIVQGDLLRDRFQGLRKRYRRRSFRQKVCSTPFLTESKL